MARAFMIMENIPSYPRVGREYSFGNAPAHQRAAYQAGVMVVGRTLSEKIEKDVPDTDSAPPTEIVLTHSEQEVIDLLDIAEYIGETLEVAELVKS